VLEDEELGAEVVEHALAVLPHALLPGFGRWIVFVCSSPFPWCPLYFRGNQAQADG